MGSVEWYEQGSDQGLSCTENIGIWLWASNDQGVPPDVVMACCGDVPTLETLTAVTILREHPPELRIRVVNVVDLMKLQPPTEHPHGLSDPDFDELFAPDKPILVRTENGSEVNASLSPNL